MVGSLRAATLRSGQRGTLFWGPKLEDMFSRAADFVHTILHDNRLPPVEAPKPSSFSITLKWPYDLRA